MILWTASSLSRDPSHQQTHAQIIHNFYINCFLVLSDVAVPVWVDCRESECLAVLFTSLVSDRFPRVYICNRYNHWLASAFLGFTFITDYPVTNVNSRKADADQRGKQNSQTFRFGSPCLWVQTSERRPDPQLSTREQEQ